MFELKISTDGAAFTVESNGADNGAPDAAPELARILRKLADTLDAGISETGDTGSVRDVNGHTVGRWSLDVPIVGPETLAEMLSAHVGTEDARRIAETETAEGPVTRHYAETLADQLARDGAAEYLDQLDD